MYVKSVHNFVVWFQLVWFILSFQAESHIIYWIFHGGYCIRISCDNDIPKINRLAILFSKDVIAWMINHIPSKVWDYLSLPKLQRYQWYFSKNLAQLLLYEILKQIIMFHQQWFSILQAVIACVGVCVFSRQSLYVNGTNKYTYWNE